jgi:peptidoglycan hydrolase-like protein with peptidoglycan-binding domain
MSYYAMEGLGAITQAAAGVTWAAAGIGAIDFNAASVWSDWQAGGASGATAAKYIQAALNQLGYGPLTVDGQFGSASLAAWARFANQNGTGDASWPTQVGIDKLGEAVVAGGTPGGGPAVESHIVGGQFVPGPAPGAGLSTGAMIAIGVVAVAGVAGIAYAMKKRKQRKVASGVVERAKAISRQAVANRRRYRRARRYA